MNMEIKEISLAELKEYPNNPRVNDHVVDGLAESIGQFGFTQPIVIDESKTIVAGHTRLKALKKLGRKKVPCVVLKDLTDEQIRAYRLLDNKLAEAAYWDAAALQVELSELDDFDFSMFNVEFPQPEVDIEDVDEDDVPEVSQDTVSEIGELWHLGDHRLFVGDSTIPDSVDRLFGDEAGPQMIFTDPPYGVDYVGKTKAKKKIKNDALSEEETFQLFSDSISLLIGRAPEGTPLYATVPAGPLHIGFCRILQDLEVWRQTLVWAKDVFVMGRSDYHYQHEPILYGWKPGAKHKFCGRRDLSTVWNIPRPKRSEEHPTMKPVKLIATAILNSSSPGDIVADPFAGSGTTLIAAQETGRRGYCIEIDPRYADVILKRFYMLTKQQPSTSEGKTFPLI